MSPDGEALATSGADGVRIYSVETGRRLQVLPESQACRWFGFSPDGTHLLACGQDGSLRLWSYREARLVANFQAGVPQFRAAFSPDGRRFLSHGHDDAVRVWDVQTAAEFCEPIRHPTPVVSAAFGPTGERVVTGTAGGSVTVWNLTSARASEVRLTHPAAVLSAAFSSDDSRIVTGSGDGIVRVWDRASHQLVSSWDVRQDGGRSAIGVRFGAEDKFILTLSRAGLRVWDARSGEPAGPLLRTENPSVAALSPDGKLVAANYSEVVEDGASARRVSLVRLWDAVTGELRFTLPQPNQIAALQFSADGSELLLANYALAVELWDVRTGKAIRKIAQGSGPLHQVAYVGRGTRILASMDSTWCSSMPKREGR